MMPELVTCADPRHEVLEALRWTRSLLATGRAEADDGYLQKGATGFSLRTLVAYLLSL